MEEFLEAVFGEEATPERRMAVFTTPDRRTRFFADYGELRRYALGQSASQNVYFGVGLVGGEPKGRGKRGDIAGVGAFWCDIDVSGAAHPKKNLPRSVEEAASVLADMPLPPSVVVSSGHGLHAYWLLQEPWIFGGDAERERAAALAKRWHGKVCALGARRGWGLENLGDLTRVLRLPGTLNHNGAGGPVEVRVVEARPHLRYAPDDFEQFLPAEEPGDAADENVVPALVLRAEAEPPALKLLDLASTSPLFWDTWSRRRNDLPDQSQSAYDLSLATIAALRGWTEQEIADLLIAARRRHRRNPDKALRDDYVRRTIAKALRAARDVAPAGEDADLSRLLVQPGGAPGGGARAMVQVIDDVERRQLEWLWPGRVPLGKLTLLAGDPGLGKSLVSLDMAARVSRGTAWPETPLLPQTAGKVVLFNAEDDLADTIAPRLDRAGADDSKIIAVEGVESRGPDGAKPLRWCFTLENDLPRLEEVLTDYPGVRLVVIDPISAYCGKTDTHKNAEVRSLLAPLAELAARRHVAVVAVTHLSKSGGAKAVYRAMGSLAFAAAARAVWAVVKDRLEPQRRLFLPAKLNLAQDPARLAYRIVEGRVEWEPDAVKMHADDAFAAEAAAAKPSQRGSERKEAGEWIRRQLAEGPVPASDVIELGEQCGFSTRTLRRAYKQLGGSTKKNSFSGPWMWELPHANDDEDAPLF